MPTTPVGQYATWDVRLSFYCLPMQEGWEDHHQDMQEHHGNIPQAHDTEAVHAARHADGYVPVSFVCTSIPVLLRVDAER